MGHGAAYWDNGKENVKSCIVSGLSWDNGKENGNYYIMLGLYWDNGKVSWDSIGGL